jgi:hypothetical protein
VICGGGGSDRLYGAGGNDVLRGGPGRDWLTGGRGVDKLDGGRGRDLLTDDGADRLTRQAGDRTEALGDYRLEGKVKFLAMPGDNVTTSQGQPTNCTRDEEYDSFRVPSDDFDRTYAMTARNDDGSCRVEASINSWRLTINGAYAGTMTMDRQSVWIGGQYVMHCDDGWKNLWRCASTPEGVTISRK